MSDPDSVDAFVDLCHRAYDKDLVSGVGGNMSLRRGDRVLITPTGCCLGSVRADELVAMRLDGTVVDGGRPSKEWRMHLRCYARAGVGAVVHLHSVHAVAVACLPDADPACAMPVYTPGYAVRVGRLPVVPYMRPGSPELADGIASLIATRDTVLLANHGVLALGAGAEQAFGLVEEIEENARLHFILAGRGRPLSDRQIQDLVGRY